MKLRNDCNLRELEQIDDINDKAFECVTKELLQWLNDKDIDKILKHMIDRAIETSARGVYEHLYDYHEDIYRNENWEEYQNYEENIDEYEEEGWDPPHYEPTFKVTDKPQLKEYLTNFITKMCYSYNSKVSFMCAITDYRILPFLSSKEQIKIIDMMVELAVKNKTIEICTHLARQL